MTEALTLREMPFEAMEAKSAAALPTGDGWQFEPKWDGFRCLAVKSGGEVALWAKSGKPLGRYFPEIVEAVRASDADGFVLDGELQSPQGGFEVLQMRLHPAESRIRKLSAELPALLNVFDLPVAPGDDGLLQHPLEQRRAALEAFFPESAPLLKLSPMTLDRARADHWLADEDGTNDGIVAKRLADSYRCGERAMLKIKRVRTADCVVGGFRYGTGSNLVGSLLLGLFDGKGKLNHVGFTSNISNAEKPALTDRLETLHGEGFTGRAPGGVSRWSTERTETYEPLRHELVVEVTYDHVTGGRFRHGSRIVRWRPDKAPAQCTDEQVARLAGG